MSNDLKYYNKTSYEAIPSSYLPLLHLCSDDLYTIGSKQDIVGQYTLTLLYSSFLPLCLYKHYVWYPYKLISSMEANNWIIYICDSDW